MSIATLTTVAAVRDSRAPTRSDVGKARPAVDASQVAKLRHLLVAQVPTEVVAPYTAIAAIIVGVIAKPTPQQPNPTQYLELRWGVFGVMIATVIALVWIGARSKQSGSRWPVLEVTGAAVAATAWAFLLPESPLAAEISDNVARAMIPAVIGFVGIMINLVIAALLKNQAT